MPSYTVDGRTYRAIRFQNEDFSGYRAHVYDLETGLMIFQASRTQGPSVITPPIGGSGRTGLGEGSSQVVTLWLVERKDIDVPWKNAPPPPWIERFGQLSYRGVQTSVAAAAGTKLDRAMTATLTPKAGGPGWVRFTNRYLFESLPGSVTISEAGPLHRTGCAYDTRTGVLSAMTLVPQIGLASITHRIQLVSPP